MAEAKAEDPDEAETRGVLSVEEAARLREAEAAVAVVIEVDDFAADGLSSSYDERAETSSVAAA